MIKTKTLKTKTKTLTIAKARKAAEVYVDLEGSARSRAAANKEMKARFRKALELPEDFRLTDKRMNDISDDLVAVYDSYTATGQRISVALLADTLYTLKWPTAYAKPMQKYFVLKG